ncbi:MAG: hypothetical protein MSS41_04455, partial [Collinsella sp.]|nr:hypothetical protein [Collinsella sp.]
MLSSNEVYYTDESAQGKNFFKKFSDPVIGDVLKRLVIQERPQRLINQTPRVVFLGRGFLATQSGAFKAR